MGRYVLRRLVLVLPQLFVLLVIAFSLTRIVPGDPMLASELGEIGLNEAELQAKRMYLGLDRPLYVQFFDWLFNVLQLNLGRSLVSGQPVVKLFQVRLIPTLLLTGTALSISLVAGITLGVVAARWRNSLYDHLMSFVAFFFLSIPAFWAAIVAIIIFAVSLRLLPVEGMWTPGQRPGLDWASFKDVLRHLVMPALILGAEGIATITRYVRSSMIEVMAEDYVRTARAKGLNERLVLSRHALRNALMPVVTIMGLRLPGLVGGAVLIERVFNWPGLGTAAVEAANSRDFPVTMAMVLIIGVLTIMGNLLADVFYGVLDPRVRDVLAEVSVFR